MFTVAAAAQVDELPRIAAGGAPPQRVAKPWGEELVLSRSEGAVCKLLRIRAGKRLSLQYHRRKRETLIVRDGRVRLTLGDSLETLRTRAVGRGYWASIPAGRIHRLEALGGDAEVLEFAFDAAAGAAGAAGADDIVRLADDYGRAELT